MKKLGGVVLPDSIRWVNEYSWSPVAHTTTRTLAGNHHVWVAAMHGGRPIDLAAEPSFTWLTQSQVDAIMELANQPGGIFELEIDDRLFRVMFRHDDPPATSFSKIRHAKACELFTGSIKLVQV
ncbi:MAG: hypothetical protein HQL89_00980 [Magnetococcales bacterium]|nr:hypothetical protein [Magnetococcales bacterium]